MSPRLLRYGDLRLQPLRVCSGWRVEFHQLFEVRPEDDVRVTCVRDEDKWQLFVEDLLFLAHQWDDIGVDLGWYPDHDPEGAFVLQVIFGSDWEHPIFRHETRDLGEVVEKLEWALLRAPAGAFGAPPQRPKERRRPRRLDPLPLSTAEGAPLADVVVDRAAGDRCSGTLRFRDGSESLRAELRELEELVNDQIFPLVDEVQARLDARGLVLAHRGVAVPVRDLQVFGEGDVSFRCAPEAVAALAEELRPRARGGDRS
jgi:hypothetical protein